MSATVAYASHEEASNAADILRDFGMLSRTEVVTDFAEPGDWWEVTIVELPAGLARLVVDRASRTPGVEPDEHDRGKSTWWDRDDHG